MSKILLTGCAGFIGSHVYHLLLEQGYDVVGLDNFNSYYDPKLKYYRLENLKNKISSSNSKSQLNFHTMDICDLTSLHELFKTNTFSAVIHLAAMAGVRYSVENPELYYKVNVQGTLGLLELIKKFKVPKLVLASTSSVYSSSEIPYSETMPVNEPYSPYAASKKAAENLSFTYHHLQNLDVSVLRFFTVLGPAGRPDMSYFQFTKAIDNQEPLTLYGDGEQARDFTDVNDIARGVVLALKPVGFEIINLGGGSQPTSINAMISQIETHLHKKAMVNQKPFLESDLKVTSANIQKAKKILDWEPQIKFNDSLKNFVEWYLHNNYMINQLRSKAA